MRNGRPDFLLAAPARFGLAAEVDPQGGPDSNGSFTCVASIFEQRVPRLFYDIVLREQCFDRSLEQRGLPALVWSHDWQTPPIGTTQRCEREGQNLVAEGTLFDPETDALRALRLAMTARNGDGRAPLREFSIGFDVVDAQWDVIDEEEVLAVTDAELYEFGPTLVGAVAGTGFLRAPEPDELLSRFPRPDGPAPASLSAEARRERGLARARLL